jgi:hypothetical protein
VGNDAPVQRIIKVRRDYNSWVASETMEDYALRFTPQRFRKWSEWRVANTAFGAASFLILEAVGATLLVKYGFTNAFWAIVATGLIIFLAGLPISIYAARYGVDMDLLTRGAGFGYIGSTLTSLIYASFHLHLFCAGSGRHGLCAGPCLGHSAQLGLPDLRAGGHSAGDPWRFGHLAACRSGRSPCGWSCWWCPLCMSCCAIPVRFRVFCTTAVRKAQAARLQFAPVWCCADGRNRADHPDGRAGRLPALHAGADAGQPLALVGVACWWAGPAGCFSAWSRCWAAHFLAYLAISNMVPLDRAVDPNQMYLAAYEYVFPHYGMAVAATAIVRGGVAAQDQCDQRLCRLAGLVEFFSRITHSHPGRVVWVVFNTLIAFMLMEMNVFQALGDVLGLYSNIAIAWVMAVVADLVINKPLGLSPPGIEFKRAHLYDINPVGVGAMALASLLSITAHLGLYGETAQAFSAVIAMGTAFVTAP